MDLAGWQRGTGTPAPRHSHSVTRDVYTGGRQLSGQSVSRARRCAVRPSTNRYPTTGLRHHPNPSSPQSCTFCEPPAPVVPRPALPVPFARSCCSPPPGRCTVLFSAPPRPRPVACRAPSLLRNYRAPAAPEPLSQCLVFTCGRRTALLDGLLRPGGYVCVLHLGNRPLSAARLSDTARQPRCPDVIDHFAGGIARRAELVYFPYELATPPLPGGAVSSRPDS
jgi:hypothetical protein